MSLRGTTIVIASIVLMATLTNAWPSGAPAGACSSLDPDTHGPSTATGTAPYALTFSSSTYQPGQVVQVRLQGAAFKGFLIVGRKADGSSTDPVGFFQNPSSDSKLQCLNGTTGNGITHTSNSVKNGLTFDWRAPSTSVGNIVFHYTIVRGGAPSTTSDPSDYYKDEQSAALSPNSQALHFRQEPRRNDEVKDAIRLVKQDITKTVTDLDKLLRRINV
ncbi:unnamed protein product [Lymnaea stagnalis]|uniref:Reelin domain-containing protein n=1 Tax=Lymnaea stagnalis TaxID=6523 RepID=A0AAV2H005_LYMST